MGIASPPDATAATAETIDALRSFLDGIGLRPRLRDLGFDAASLDVVAADAVADPAILNAPRIPSVTEARAILEAVLLAVPPSRPSRPDAPGPGQPASMSGFTSPMNRSKVSTSYGAGCSEITVWKPIST